MNNEPDYDNLYFEPKAKGTLTEQWKKGELPVSSYYASYLGEPRVWSYRDKQNQTYDLEYEIYEVLAKVPSYDEYMMMKDCAKKEFEAVEKYTKVKELLKECKDLIELMQAISGIKQIKFTVIDDFVKKINEVLDA